jgi:hypothetical protein
MFKSKILIVLAVVLVSFIVAFSITNAKPNNPSNDILSKLDEIISMLGECCKPIKFAGVPKTGVTMSFATGDDGDIQAGIEWPDPRFTDNGDGTVTDNLTQLIWLKNADCFGLKDWYTAIEDCNTLDNGECGLSDCSVEGDWRLPNIKEFQSLFHYGYSQPALPNTDGTSKWSEGDPFNSVMIDLAYWTSNTNIGSNNDAKPVFLINGSCGSNTYKTQLLHVWAVRGGN